MHIFYKSIELSCHSATCFVILPCCSIYDASACAVVIRSKSLSFKLIRQWNKPKKLFFERVIFNLYPHKCLFIVREYHNPESLYTFSVNHAPIVEFLPSDSAGGSRGTLDWIVIGRIEMTSSRRAKRIQKVFFAALIYLRNYKAELSQQENLHLLIWLRMPQKSSPATRGMVICFLRRMILCLYIF